MPGPQGCVGGGLRVVTRGMGIGARFRGASGTPPPTVCREWAAAGTCPSSGPAGPPSPTGEGKGCCWRQRKPPRGVGDAAPYGLPGMGGDGSLPLIRPCGATFPRGGRQGLYGGSGTPPPTPAAGPRCGAGGSGCSTSGLTKPAQYRRNPGRCRGGSRR